MHYVRRAQECSGYCGVPLLNGVGVVSATGPDIDKNPYFSSYVPFLIILVLALVGCFAAGFLTYRHILLMTQTGGVTESALCRADGKISCDAVLTTDYAHLAPYVSSAVAGLAGIVFALWCAINAVFNDRIRKLALTALVVYFFAAIGVSWYFVFLMIFTVSHICPWCIVVHIVNLLSLVTVVIVSVKKKQEFLIKEVATLGERVYFVAGGVLLSLVVFFVCGMVEKELGFRESKVKYDDIANDPVVIMAILKASPPLEVPITDKDPVFGSPKAMFPLVAFSDFACPICSKRDEFLRKLVMANPDVLKLVFKCYPLSTDCNRLVVGNLHPMGCDAARAALAAFFAGGNQAFWDYTALLYGNQSSLRRKPWVEFADRLKLDPNKFQEQFNNGSPADLKLQQDIELGVQFKLTATPQIIFQQRKLPETFHGAFFVHILQDLIREFHPDRNDLKLRLP
jgi:protein-disulfide isomerase/uncharacterized membrane protein